MSRTASSPGMRTPRQAEQRSGEPRRLMLAVLLLAGIFAMHGVQIVCGHMGSHTLDEAVQAAREAHAAPGDSQSGDVAVMRQVRPDGVGRKGVAGIAEGRSAATMSATDPAPADRPYTWVPGARPQPTDAGPVMGLCIAVLGSGVLLYGLLLRVDRSRTDRSDVAISAAVSSYLRSRRRRPCSPSRTLLVLCVSRT
jgi:hypothetical protein